MPSTQNFGLSYPLSSDAPAGSMQLQALANDTDAALTGVNAKSEHNEQNHNNNTDRLVKVENRLVTLEAEIDAAADNWELGPFSYLLQFDAPAGTKFEIRKFWTVRVTGLTRGPNPFRPSEVAGGKYPLNFSTTDAVYSGYGGWYGSFDIAWYIHGGNRDEFKLALMPRRTWTMPNDGNHRKFWVKLLISDHRARGGRNQPGIAPHSASGLPDPPPEVMDDQGNPITGIVLPNVTNDEHGSIDVDMGAAATTP